MAGRWEHLAVEAHCRRAIDFAANAGPYWRLKEELVLDRIEDHLASDVMEMSHAWHAAAAGSDLWDVDGKTFEYHRRAANRIYRDVGKLKLPWYKRWRLDDGAELVRRIRQFYAQERDPKFREWRDKVKKEMNDRIRQIEEDQKTLARVKETLKASQAEREKKAREAHERRKARTRSAVRGIR